MTTRASLDLTNVPRLMQWLALWRPGAPLLLDAFCGAGGAAVGYKRAGFNVVGCDHEPQPHYPFPFIEMDAIEFIRQFGPYADAIHASPPCQRYSSITRTAGTQDTHPDLLAETRTALRDTGKPYAIENVPGAPLHNPLMLCGTMFGLLVVRHRLFECNPPVWFAPGPCQHLRPVVKHGRRPDTTKHYAALTGHMSDVGFAREASGIGWMSQGELAKSIPPAYTEYIGAHLLRVVEARRAAQIA